MREEGREESYILFISSPVLLPTGEGAFLRTFKKEDDEEAIEEADDDEAGLRSWGCFLRSRIIKKPPKRMTTARRP